METRKTKKTNKKTKKKQQQQKENPHTLTGYMIKNLLVNVEKRTVSLLF